MQVGSYSERAADEIGAFWRKPAISPSLSLPSLVGMRRDCQDLVEHRKKSWELYGYDFMVDDQYKPWLIEINSSPACDYSTKVGIRIR